MTTRSLGEEGSVRLGELTLAKALDDSQAALTRPGEIVGDYQYLAPWAPPKPYHLNSHSP